MRDVVDALAQRGQERSPSRYGRRRTLLASGVQPWVGLPLWIPASDPDSAGFMEFDCRRARRRARTAAAHVDTIADTAAWLRGRDNAGAWKLVLGGRASARSLRSAGRRRLAALSRSGRSTDESAIRSGTAHPRTRYDVEPGPNGLTAMATPSPSALGQPARHRRLRVHRVRGARPAALGRLFESMGFTAVARHRSKNVLLYRQGEINFIVNAEPDSFAQSFARVHGPSICAIAFRVKDCGVRRTASASSGAWGVEAHPGPMELNIPAIKGIGDSLIYPRRSLRTATARRVDLRHRFRAAAGVDSASAGAGLTYIDHLTHNVHRGRMDEWASSTSACSISARSATSTSRASSPA
jgi:hypothetical protein